MHWKALLVFAELVTIWTLIKSIVNGISKSLLAKDAIKWVIMHAILSYYESQRARTNILANKLILTVLQLLPTLSQFPCNILTTFLENYNTWQPFIKLPSTTHSESNPLSNYFLMNTSAEQQANWVTVAK